jgi:hypothetical protein
MKVHAYLFEARAIQSFILDSGKLRDLVGASELVDMLCEELLDDALEASGLKPSPADMDEAALGNRIVFARKAGGAFYAFSGSESSIERLAAVWPLVVQQHAPGLAFDQGRGQGGSAYTAYRSAREDPVDGQPQSGRGLIEDRSRGLVELPQAGPLVLRSQRTGRPAVKVTSDPEGEPEPLDASASRQRWAVRRGKNSLTEKVSPLNPEEDRIRWPIDLEPGGEDAFPFVGDNRYIAVVHADGNGLGQLLIRLEKHVAQSARNDYLQVFRRLSKGIEEVAQAAVREAVGRHLVPHGTATGMVPARPIVLGGDDLTMIIRADLALAFTRTFLAQFEERSRGLMEDLQALGLPVPERLTACAGIAYIKAGQPFYLGANLAEGIAASVKTRAKKINRETPPSSLAWHGVTTAMIDDYEHVLERELTVGARGKRYRNTLGAYAVSPPLDETSGKLPALDDLLDLQRLFERPDMARGPTRQILTLIDRNEAQAIALYRRWCTLMQDPANGKEERFRSFSDSMEKLLGAKLGDLPYRDARKGEGNCDRVGPLGDLHALLAVKNRAVGSGSRTDTTGESR